MILQKLNSILHYTVELHAASKCIISIITFPNKPIFFPHVFVGLRLSTSGQQKNEVKPELFIKFQYTIWNENEYRC